MADFKIGVIRGTNEAADNRIVFTADRWLPCRRGGSSRSHGSRSIRLAARSPSRRTTGTRPRPSSSTPTSATRCRSSARASRSTRRPCIVLSKLRGPLAVEGGVTGADRSLQNGITLPGEIDGPLFAIGAQPPESRQIDVLNIFHDGSQQDGDGVMTSTTLRGFGMAATCDFGHRPTRSASPPTSPAASASARSPWSTG